MGKDIFPVLLQNLNNNLKLICILKKKDKNYSNYANYGAIFFALGVLWSHKKFVYTKFKVQNFEEFGTLLQIILARVATVFVLGLWSHKIFLFCQLNP